MYYKHSACPAFRYWASTIFLRATRNNATVIDKLVPSPVPVLKLKAPMRHTETRLEMDPARGD